MNKLEAFFNSDEEPKVEIKLLDWRGYYVYALLDIRKPGKFIYEKNGLRLDFDYEPFYIGCGQDDRMHDHLVEAMNFYGKTIPKGKGWNSHKIGKIHKLVDIEGWFPIIKIKDTLTRKEALQYEILCIAVVGRLDLGLGPLTNMTNGGDGLTGWTEQRRKESSIRLKQYFKENPMSDEERRLRSINATGKNNPMYGHNYTDEERKEKSKKLKGKMAGKDNPNYGNLWTNEQREEHGKKLKGRKKIYNEELNIVKTIRKEESIPPGFVLGDRPCSAKRRESLKCCNIDTKGEKNPMFGKHHTEESKRIQKEKRELYYSTHEHPMKGKKHTEEAKAKMRKPKRKKNKNV